MKLPPYYVQSPTYCKDEIPKHLCTSSLNQLLLCAHTPFPFDVQQLLFESRAPLPDFSFMNPSIMPAPDGHGFIFAIRETSCHSCHGHVNNHHVYYSTVLFGYAPTARGPMHYSGNFSHIIKWKVTVHFQGPEDPRFMSFPDPNNPKRKGLYLMTVLGGTLHMSHLVFNRTQDGVFIHENGHVQLWLKGTFKSKPQKNWMYIPDAVAQNGHPLLCYKLNPMEVVSVDLNSGLATYVSQQPKNKCVPNLRGSSNFLHHPTKPNIFTGIGHETILPEGVYYSRIVSMEEYAPMKFRLVGMSDRFGLPTNKSHTCVNCIHYPSSISYTDNKETITIGMGYMDCTVHTVVVKTSHFLNALKPVPCLKKTEREVIDDEKPHKNT